MQGATKESRPRAPKGRSQMAVGGAEGGGGLGEQQVVEVRRGGPDRGGHGSAFGRGEALGSGSEETTGSSE